MKPKELEIADKIQLARYTIGDLHDQLVENGFNYIYFMSNVERIIYQLLTDKTNLIVEIGQKVVISDGRPTKDIVYKSTGDPYNKTIEFIMAHVECFGDNR